MDPLAPSYPWNSTYAFAEGDVIRSIDLDGCEKKVVIFWIDFSGGTSALYGDFSLVDVQTHSIDLFYSGTPHTEVILGNANTGTIYDGVSAPLFSLGFVNDEEPSADNDYIIPSSAYDYTNPDDIKEKEEIDGLRGTRQSAITRRDWKSLERWWDLVIKGESLTTSMGMFGFLFRVGSPKLPIIKNKTPYDIQTNGGRRRFYEISGITIKKGKIMKDGKPYTGAEDFVITSNGELKLGSGHGYLSGNADQVGGAGYMVINNGKVIKMTNQTGHYRTSAKEQMQTFVWLRRKGVADKSMKAPIDQFDGN